MGPCLPSIVIYAAIALSMLPHSRHRADFSQFRYRLRQRFNERLQREPIVFLKTKARHPQRGRRPVPGQCLSESSSTTNSVIWARPWTGRPWVDFRWISLRAKVRADSNPEGDPVVSYKRSKLFFRESIRDSFRFTTWPAPSFCDKSNRYSCVDNAAMEKPVPWLRRYACNAAIKSKPKRPGPRTATLSPGRGGDDVTA